MSTLADLTPDKRNARKRTERSSSLLEKSLSEVGAARSIVIDENNVILAGNGTVEAAASVGITNVQIVEADGNTIIAVRRRGLTKKQKERLALYDNRTAELAVWDVDILADMAETPDILAGLFSDEELSNLLPDFDPASIDEQGRLDEKQMHKCPNCGHEF